MKEEPNSQTPADAGDDAISFEDAMGRLERIVTDLEGGRFSLEECLQRFEEGIALGYKCRVMLDRADLRVRTLVESGDRLIVSDKADASDEDTRA